MRTTLQDRMQAGASTGFDYLRVGLSLAVLIWHSLWISTGSNLDKVIWASSWRPLPAIILPAFFALSGFLIAGSLSRVRLHHFIALRVIRILPALTVDIVLSALILGPLFTALPLPDYFRNKEFYSYLLNMAGIIHYRLPGVFLDNPGAGIVNGQLWTIPSELECYLGLAALALIGVVRRRTVFAASVAVLIIVMTVRLAMTTEIEVATHVPSRTLITAFLAAVTLHLFRDRLPYSHVVGFMSLFAALVLLRFPACSYLAAFPVAYATVWIGLMRPAALIFGDLSYGIYLFHFQIEQSVVHLMPAVRSWWLLTLVALPPTLLCAWLSWTFIELPILRRKRTLLATLDACLSPASFYLRRWFSKSERGELIRSEIPK